MVTIQELFSKLSHCYKTIHIKSLALEKGSLTLNVATHFTFSNQELKQSVVDEAQHTPLHLIEAVLPIEHWIGLESDISHGSFHLGHIEVTLNRPEDLGGYNGGFDYINGEWPVWQASNSQPKDVGASKLTNTDTALIEKCVKKFGYNDLRTFIQHRIGIKGYSETAIWYFSVPIYARISDVKINKVYRPVISVVHHKDLGYLKLSVTLRGKDYDTKDHYPYDIITEKEDYSTTELVLPAINDKPVDSDALHCNLLHPVVGETIDSKYLPIKELILKSGLVLSPLFRAASLFFKDDALLQTLKSPKKANRNDGPQIAFEAAVGNLLALGGFETVLFGDYDVVRDESSREIGAADIIAYDKKSGTLLVISCKTILPAQDVVDRIIHTTMLVKERIKNPLIEIVPVIATAQLATDLKERAKNLGVLVFDGTLIEQLYKNIKLRPLSIDDFKEKSVWT